jgi:hypothetical protein
MRSHISAACERGARIAGARSRLRTTSARLANYIACRSGEVGSVPGPDEPPPTGKAKPISTMRG